MNEALQDMSDQEKTSSGGLWTALEQAVEQEQEPQPTQDLWETLQDRMDLSKRKPKHITHAEVASHQTASGEEYYVLKNPEANTYLKLDPRDYFLWELMDGEHSIRDLAVAYFVKFGAFPFDRLGQLVAQLKMNDLLEEKPVHVFGAIAHHFAAQTLAYRLKQFSETSTQKEFSLKNADRFFDTLYRRGGWLLFTRPAKALYVILTAVGIVSFIRGLLAGTYPLLSTAGSYGLGLTALVLLNLVMVFFHECGHALTCKSYGRRVPKGGLLFYMGSPAFFVDTTDIWMEPKRARIAVSLAGPVTTVLMGSLSAVFVGVFSSFPLNPILFQAAFVGYVGALMNLNPLLELDGYYVLMDWLDIPLLRQRALAFVREELLAKLFKERGKFSREERIFTIFGILAAVWTGLTVALTVYLWQSRVATMVRNLLSGRDLLSLLLIGGLMVMSGATLILGLIVKALLLASEGAARLRRFAQIQRARRS
jgi:putative peptide zinc metalloprotease protein